MSHGPPVGDVLARLDGVLDDAALVPLSCLGPDDARAWLVGLQRARARVDGLVCAGLAGVASLDDGAAGLRRSVGDVVAAEARADRRVLAADQGLAVWLRSYPFFAEAFIAGWLTRAHLGVLRRLDNRRTRVHLVEAQEYLVDAARSLPFREFTEACRYWALAFDPDGEEPVEQVARRALRLSRDSDGMVTGSFTLDPVAGHAFCTALERQAQRLFQADSADPDTVGQRTATQRRADALVDLVTRGAMAAPGGDLNPLIHVVVSEEVAEDLIARAAGAEADDADDGAGPEPGREADLGRSDRLPVRFGDIDGRCELIDGTPLHPRFVLALLATATFRRMVFGAGNEITDLGRAVRGFPPRLRQALLVQARGRCRSPGCDAPLAWLQADHLIPWARHGPTAVSNGQILCDPHNKAKRDHPAGQPDDQPGRGQSGPET